MGANLWVANSDGTIGEYNATTGAPAVSPVSIADGESATLTSLTITIENHHVDDLLTSTAGGGITVTPYNPTTGVLQLSGTASLLAYETVLASVQYNNTNGGPGVTSETVNVVANDGISHSNPAQATIVFTLPKVIGVQVDGTAWSPNFLTALQAAGEGDGTGYAIPVGSAAQSAPLPWTNVNQIQIAFNEGVNVQESSLTLSGVNVANYAFSGFSYNAATDVAMWTLSNPISSDKLSLDLHSTGPYAVTDAAGKPLDGEWTNAASTYPSGNGVVGGDFNFGFNVLPGDTSQDGIVNGLDITRIASHWLQVGGITGDTNGDNIVNGLDIAAVASHWLATLPAAGPDGGSGSGVEVVALTTAGSALSVFSVMSPMLTSSPSSSTAHPTERTAAFVSQPDQKTRGMLVDLALIDESATDADIPTSLAKFPSTVTVADDITATAGELPMSVIDEELLATLAAARES